MLGLETFKLCHWRNEHAHHPVIVGTVSLGDAFGWTTDRLSPAVFFVFKEKLPGVLPDSRSIGAGELVARLAQHIQLLTDVTASACGVVSHDEAKRQAVLFFSCMDTFIAPRCLSLAVQIIDRLAASDVSAERFARC